MIFIAGVVLVVPGDAEAEGVGVVEACGDVGVGDVGARDGVGVGDVGASGDAGTGTGDVGAFGVVAVGEAETRDAGGEYDKGEYAVDVTTVGKEAVAG